MQHRAGDPEVEALLRLGRATEFKAPDGTNTRAQLHRCIRGDKERELCRRLTTVFRGGNDAGPKRVAAAAARAEGAADKRTLTHHQLLSRVREKSKIIAARIQEQDQTYEKLAIEVQAQQLTALEEHGKLARQKQEQEELRERALSLGRLRQRGRQLQPMLEEVAAHQRETLQAARARMATDRDPATARHCEDVAPICHAIQQELWQQVNAASMACSDTGQSMLMLTGGPMDEDDVMALVPVGWGADSQSLFESLERHLRLSRDSPVQRSIAGLLVISPRRVVQAVWELCRASLASLEERFRHDNLLAEAKQHWQQLYEQQNGAGLGAAGAAAAAVDPLYDLQQKRQAFINQFMELQKLRVALQQIKLRLLELAQVPAVREVLAQPRALLQLKALAYRAKRHEAEACLEELRADVRSLGAVERQQGGVGGQGRVASVTDEVQKLQEVVWQQEQEQRRLEDLMAVLVDLQRRTMEDWQQGHSTDVEFVKRMLPQAYKDLAEKGGDGTDLLARGAHAVMQVPQELLPMLAEQRAAREGSLPGSGTFTQGPTLLQRLQLSARHVSSQRAVAALRSSMLRGAPAALQFAGAWPHGGAGGPNSSSGGRSAFGSGQLHSHASGGFGARGSGGDVFGSGGGLGAAASGPGARLGGFGSGAVGEGASMASGLGPVQWAPGPAALGLPAVCYWVSVASLVEELAVLRCPSDLLQRLKEGFMWQWEQARWLAGADQQLQGKQQEVTELGPVAEALRQRLAAKRGVDASQRADPLKRSLAEIVAQFGVCRPRIERALRDMQELGAVRLVPWRKVNGQTSAEYLDEIRSLFDRINQLQQGVAPFGLGPAQRQQQQPAFGAMYGGF